MALTNLVVAGFWSNVEWTTVLNVPAADLTHHVGGPRELSASVLLQPL